MRERKTKSRRSPSPPTPQLLNWVLTSVGEGAQLTRLRRLQGGIGPPIHALVVRDRIGQRLDLVLRHWRQKEERMHEANKEVNREARTLASLSATDLPVPRLVASDPTGNDTGGEVAVLMTRVPGRMALIPRDPEDWLSQMARVLPRVHSAGIRAPAYESWLDLDSLRVPEWAETPEAWERAIGLAPGTEASYEPRFIHRDYQHFNLLWSRGKLTGIVDWQDASIGSPDVDVAHCRLNLAVLFSADWAERFRVTYEAEAGRSVDPWWDAVGVLTYLPGWRSGIQVQTGSRKKVDLDGMNARVEELLEIALRRL